MSLELTAEKTPELSVVFDDGGRSEDHRRGSGGGSGVVVVTGLLQEVSGDGVHVETIA